MRLGRSLIVIVALIMVGVVVPKSAQADQWNKRTLLTFSQDVEMSGTVLPAGTYVFQLADSLFRRHVVQVFDQHGRILAMVVTIPTARLKSDNIRIAFDESPAGSAHPIKAWFYPGCLDGEAFLHPNRSKSTITD